MVSKRSDEIVNGLIGIAILILLCQNWIELPLIGGCSFINWHSYLEASRYIGGILDKYTVILKYTYIAPFSILGYIGLCFLKMKGRIFLCLIGLISIAYNLYVAILITDANNNYFFYGKSVLSVYPQARIALLVVIILFLLELTTIIKKSLISK